MEFAFDEQGTDAMLEFTIKKRRVFNFNLILKRFNTDYIPILFFFIRVENNREYFSACLEDNIFFLDNNIFMCNDGSSLFIFAIVSSKLIRDTNKFPLNFDPCDA